MTHRLVARCAMIAVAGLCSLLLLPISARAAAYGIDDYGPGCNAWTAGSPPSCTGGFSPYSFNTYYPTSTFTNFQHAVPLGYVRFFVPYDAAGYWNGSACAASPAYSTGGNGEVAKQDFTLLIDRLEAAKAAGLKVEISITDGTQIGGTPLWPVPVDKSTGQISTTQFNDYRCGVRSLMFDLQSDSNGGSLYAPPTEYEAFNEPDVRSAYQGGNGALSGPYEAAYLWYTAQADANYFHAQVPSSAVLQVAALTMSRANDNPYLDSYYQSVGQLTACDPGQQCQSGNKYYPTTMPSVWAVHDYNDVTANGTKDLQQFENELDADAVGDFTPPNATVWVTEAGVQLDNTATRDANYPNGVSCNSGNSASGDTDNARTLGCLVDGNATAQASGAKDWKALGNITAGKGVITTTQVYWYEFKLFNTQHAFDSAFVDSNGHPRPSYCALLASSDCSGNTLDYLDPNGTPGHP